MVNQVKGIIDQVEIRWKGIYEFTGLYQLIRHFLDHKRYDYMETLYKDKVSGPWGNEVDIKMEPELKVTEYVKYHIHIFIKLYDFTEFEAEIDGQKRKVSDSRGYIRLNCSVDLDYSNKIKEGTWQHKLQSFVVDKLLDRYFQYKYYDQLAEQVYELQAEIKRYLKMET